MRHPVMVVVLALVLGLMLALSGCGQDSTPTPSPTPAPESGSESAGSEATSEASREAAMSSPITPWDGVLGGLAVSARYDAATMTVHGTVRNTTQQRLCYVQAEPHLKMETKTVGELGPDKLEDLDPGQQAATSLVATGVSFDGYVIHMEVSTAAAPAPCPRRAERVLRARVAAVVPPLRRTRPMTG